MPRYRYEAVDSSGVPIHGTAETDTEPALAELLSQRRQKLISATELSLDSLLTANRSSLPRLYQLRVGEQLREALLTGLPAHHAVRAIAAEPMAHPLQGVIPWLQIATMMIAAGVLAMYRFTGESLRAVILSSVLAFIVIPMLSVTVKYMYQIRPKRLLRKLADRLESGHAIEATLRGAMPAELRRVMEADIDDNARARVAADLVPNSVSGHHQTQQFVVTLIAPLALLSVMLLGMYTSMLLVVPRFKRIFEDFGTDLPAITQLFISISDMVVSLGTAGWIVFAVISLGGLILLAAALGSGRISEILEPIPVFGIAFRWAMQARVARVLSSMIRNNCAFDQALKTATAASGFMQVQRAGEVMVLSLQTGGKPPAGSMNKLSGLPISMLFADATKMNEGERRGAIADAFGSLSEMLSNATVGQGRLFALAVQFAIVMFTGFVVALGVLSMFLPLIKLLNDLS